jgi:transcriptional regulator NrdR family protein
MKTGQMDRGLTCRRCGSQELRVVYTRRRPIATLMRRRECRQCGERVTTWERAIGADSQPRV